MNPVYQAQAAAEGRRPPEDVAAYVSLTGHSVSPRHLEQSAYFDRAWVGYVLYKLDDSRTRPTRLLTSHGGYTTRDGHQVALGDKFYVYNQQNRALLGVYQVVGITRADNGAWVGDVPPLKLKHCVAK